MEEELADWDWAAGWEGSGSVERDSAAQVAAGWDAQAVGWGWAASDWASETAEDWAEDWAVSAVKAVVAVGEGAAEVTEVG